MKSPQAERCELAGAPNDCSIGSAMQQTKPPKWFVKSICENRAGHSWFLALTGTPAMTIISFKGGFALVCLTG